mgnify:CR=1 FL=1
MALPFQECAPTTPRKDSSAAPNERELADRAGLAQSISSPRRWTKGDAGFQSEWLSGRTYAERVANISGTGIGPRNNGDFFLQPGATVLDDGAVDTLLGGSELDWLIYRLTQDIFSDEEPGETKTGT